MARKKKIKSPDDFKVGDLVMFVGSGPTIANLDERKQKGIGIIIENNDGVFLVAYQGVGFKTESYYCVEKFV